MPPNTLDEDLMDALLLATPDGMGGSLWHPSRLEDFHDLPAGVLDLLRAFQSGQARGSALWWWAKGDQKVGRRSHLYAPAFRGIPDGPALCGFDVADDPKAAGFDWYRTEPVTSPCLRCDAAAGGRSAAPDDTEALT